MQTLSRNLIQTAAYACAIMLSKGVSLLMLPIVTHALPLAEYGRLELWVACADIGSVILGFSLVDALFRFSGGSTSSDDKREKAATIFGIAISVMFLGLVLGQCVATPLLTLLPDGLPELECRILLATLSLTACIQIPLAWLRMQDKAFLYCGVFAGKAIIQAGLILLALHHGYGVTAILAAGLMADIAVTVMLIILQYRDTGIIFSWKVTRQILPYNMPLILGGLAGCILGSFDRMILAPMVGSEALAHYALAGKFALIVALLAEPFNMWWFPRRFAVLEESEGTMKTARCVMLGTAYITFSAALLSLIAPFLVLLLTPESYHPAIVWIPFLCALAALHAVTNLMTVGVYMGKTGTLPTVINLFSAAVAFTGYMLLIPDYGVAGAIGATFIAFITRFICFFTMSQKRIYIPYSQGIYSLMQDMKQIGGRYVSA